MASTRLRARRCWPMAAIAARSAGWSMAAPSVSSGSTGSATGIAATVDGKPVEFALPDLGLLCFWRGRRRAGLKLRSDLKNRSAQIRVWPSQLSGETMARGKDRAWQRMLSGRRLDILDPSPHGCGAVRHRPWSGARRPLERADAGRLSVFGGPAFGAGARTLPRPQSRSRWRRPNSMPCCTMRPNM